MKTLRIIVTSLLLALSVPVFAQMTDEQVVEYVKDAASQGKGEGDQRYIRRSQYHSPKPLS